MPTLSVVIPNFNHGKFLPDCLEAILSQSLQPHEILIIDDASTDNSLEVIANYQKSSPSICLKRNTQNRGVISTANEALGLISGDYVAFCAADDIIFPGFFSSTMDLIAKDQRLGLCMGDDCTFEDRRPYVFQKKAFGLKMAAGVIEPAKISSILWRQTFFIPSHATIYKTALVRRYGGFDPQLKHLCDWYLNYQIALRHPVGYVPQPFAAVRILGTSYGATVNGQKNLRNSAFQHLLNQLKGSDIEKVVCKTGLLAQIGISMLLYLCARPSYWKFLPRAFKKKWEFFWKKRERTENATG